MGKSRHPAVTRKHLPLAAALQWRTSWPRTKDSIVFLSNMRFVRALRQGLQVFSGCRERIVYLPYPKGLIGPASHICHQLPQAPIRIAFAAARPMHRTDLLIHVRSWKTFLDFRHSRHIEFRKVVNHFCHNCVARPQLSCACRPGDPVVDPQISIFPRVTCSGGIPIRDLPYFAICLANLVGSAPCERLGGRY